MKLKIFFAALSLLFNHTIVFSQEADTLLPASGDSAQPIEIQQNKEPVFLPPDTGLALFHYYDPVDRAQFFYRNTGALGTAAFPLVCSVAQQMGFQTGYRQFDLYRFTKQNIPFYKNTRPFSQLNLLIGLKKEQTVNVAHSQNIGKKFNFGFHYLRYATTGLYTRQRTRHNDIAFTTAFDSKKRYLLKTIFLLNNIRADENGGVQETTLFQDTSFLSKQLVDVALNDADNRQREIAFHWYHAVHNQDSTKAKTWELYQEADVARRRFTFSDNAPDSAFYGLFFKDDTSATGFRSELQHVSAGTKAGFRKFFRKNISIDAAAAYTFHLVQQDSFPDMHTSYLTASFTTSNDTLARIFYRVSFIYSFLDYNKNDFRGDAIAGYSFGDAGTLRLQATYGQTAPALLYNRFAFGNISWENNYRKQKFFCAGLQYSLLKYHLRISAQFNLTENFVFWDENRLPAQQAGAPLSVWTFELRKLFRIRYFGIDNLLRVQIVSDKNLLRFPVYWGIHSFFYERGVFKNKLLTRVGVDIRYNTNYRAPGYFPLTGQFYLQNAATIAFYPVLDFYVCFKIKTVRLFFKMQHLNQGMFKDKGYFNAYKYPAGDRTFRFGLSWMFLD